MGIGKKIYDYFREREVETAILVIIIAVACMVVTLLGLWAIDISVSAMGVNNNVDGGNVPGGYMLSNGFRQTDPVKMYHYGIWAVIITNFILIVIISHITVAYLKKKLENGKG